MSKLNVLVCCGAGMGSSQLLKMKAMKVFKELNIDAKLDHCAIDEARSSARNYDLVICNNRFLETLPKDVEAIGLKNILSEEEIKSKLIEKGIGQ